MRTMLFVTLLVLAGCASDPPKQKSKLPFSLDMPESLELLHGETVKRDVAVHWEPAEREDLEVTVAVEPEGKGVTVKVEPAKLVRGVGPIQVEIGATETAAPGEYVLALTAKGKSGEAKGTMTLKVPRKE